MVKNKIKRCFPLLLALVVLISFIPVIPASAASSLTLSGCWKIGSCWEADVEHGDLRDFSISVDAYVYANGSMRSIKGIFLDSRDPEFLGAFYQPGSPDRMWESSGDHFADGGLIYFNTPVTITDSQAIAFFSTYASQVISRRLLVDSTLLHDHYEDWDLYYEISQTGVYFCCELCQWEYEYTYSGTGTLNGFLVRSTLYSGDGHVPIDGSINFIPSVTSSGGGSGSTQPYSSTVTIGSSQFVFPSSVAAPKVTLTVNDAGATLTDGSKAFTYTYLGLGSFLGFSYAFSGSPSFVPGQTYELAAGDHMLYPISDAPLPVQPTTTINIYNNAGTQLLYSFKASSADASPRVTVAPSASSITFTVPDQDPVVFSGVYSSFTGLALKPQATAPAVVLGQTLSIGGKTSDSVLDLYCTYESGFADPSGTDFVSWLATAVGGFLAFELWPGMSLDQVLWVILVIGILMWFLKVIM